KARCHLKEESKTENLFKHLVFLDNEGMIVISFLVISVIVLMLIGGLGIYNRLITLRNRLKNAFSQIDVQLKRRYDLIPNLVETVKAYLKHERETLESVIR